VDEAVHVSDRVSTVAWFLLMYNTCILTKQLGLPVVVLRNMSFCWLLCMYPPPLLINASAEIISWLLDCNSKVFMAKQAYERNERPSRR
jgi:hypothetical protein